MMSENLKRKRLVECLGYAGALPFVALAVGCSVNSEPQLLFAFISYSAVILSFLGGINWGITMNDPKKADDTKILLISLTPSLVGWAALLFNGTRLVLFSLFIAFTLQYLFDRVVGRNHYLPPWHLQLRGRLTFIVNASILFVLSSTLSLQT
jgi:hypothetical protein